MKNGNECMMVFKILRHFWLLFFSGFLRESFESHPDFELPIGGYLLDLDSQSCDNHMLNKFVESLRKELKNKKSEYYNSVIKSSYNNN